MCQQLVRTSVIEARLGGTVPVDGVDHLVDTVEKRSVGLVDITVSRC